MNSDYFSDTSPNFLNNSTNLTYSQNNPIKALKNNPISSTQKRLKKQVIELRNKAIFIRVKIFREDNFLCQQNHHRNSRFSLLHKFPESFLVFLTSSRLPLTSLQHLPEAL